MKILANAVLFLFGFAIGTVGMHYVGSVEARIADHEAHLKFLDQVVQSHAAAIRGPKIPGMP